ncbi:PAS domain S-box protein [Methanobacterium sp. CWC-01]|nr:PAS domain S-box protein [Methanobacterium sp. CWC-01]
MNGGGRINLEDLESGELFELIFNSIPDAITIINCDHKVVRVNRSMANSMGMEPEDLIGKSCYEVVHGTSCPINTCPHVMLMHDEEEHSAEVHEENLGGFFMITTTPLYDNGGNVMGSVHVARDITERKIMEEQLEQALEDKDILMKEIHHRVKNNLMIMASLLNMQSRYIEDEVAKDIFKDSQSRAKTMALIHEKLYQSKELKKLDAQDYMESLARDIYHAYIKDPQRIQLDLEVEQHMLDINTVIPLGLILNEILTNTFKYAFPGDSEGVVNVRFKGKENKQFLLEVADDGIGLPPDFPDKKTDSLGMRLIHSLTEQIMGELEINSDHGTQIRVKFQELKYPKK